MQTDNYVNWDYVCNNPGQYQLKDSRELFFVMKNNLVYYWIPDEQSLGMVVNHNFWANSLFLPTNV